jgi:hypothetical protein
LQNGVSECLTPGMGVPGAVSRACSGVRGPLSAERSSGAGTPYQSWPMRSHLELAALPTAPACARGHVRSVAHEWGLGDRADAAELLTSELVTNSVQAYERLKLKADRAVVPVVGIWLVSDRHSIVIHVWDACDEMPVRRDGGPDAIDGRGLLLVESLGKDWGAYCEPGGKVVWVSL